MNNERTYNVTKLVTATSPSVKIPAATYFNGVASATGTGIDTKGYDGATIYLIAGTFSGDGSCACSIWESATDDASAAALVTGATFVAISTATDETAVKGYVLTSARMRYIWLKTVATGTGDMYLAAVVVLGRPTAMPEKTAADLVFCVDGSV